MGKKSLLKSTSKKKAAPKKTTTKKTAAKKKAGAKKNTAKKSTPKKKAAAKKKSKAGATKGPAVKKTSGAKPVAEIKEEKTTPEIEAITPEEKPQATIVEATNSELIAGKKAEPVDKVTEEESPAVVIQSEEHTKDTNSEEPETADKLYEEKATETVIHDEEATDEAANEEVAIDTTIKKPETDEEFKNDITGPASADAIEELNPVPASTIHKTIHNNPETFPPPGKIAHENADSTGKMPIIFGAALLVIIMILITGISISNSKKYYLEYRNGAIKIFKGTFEPVGKSLLIILPGIEAPKPAKAVYTKEEIYPIISKYYINKAATLLEVPGMPDFKGVKIYLQKATKFATSEKLLNEAERRIQSIDFMVLIYKADLMEDTGTLSGFEDAIRYLNGAASMSTDKTEAEIVQKKIAAVQKLIDDAKKKTDNETKTSTGVSKDNNE
ncbi:MAG: hypothetical protein HN931_02550 [Desulfobacterales bacterium]|nr:hypothetical protein [Desulfobacterales bacterium]